MVLPAPPRDALAYLPLFIYSLRYDNWVIVDGILNSIDVSLCLPRTRVTDVCCQGALFPIDGDTQVGIG